MSPEEGVAVPRAAVKPQGSAESGARAGWWELLPKEHFFSPTNSESKALEPLPNFSACLRGSRSPRRDREQPPGGVFFWPRRSQPGLPKPDGPFWVWCQSPAVPGARQPPGLAAGGLSGNVGIVGIRRWGIGEPAGEEELPETRVEPGGAMREISGNQRQRLGRVCVCGRAGAHVCEHVCAGEKAARASPRRCGSLEFPRDGGTEGSGM